jgi:hypothetical protein
VSAQLADGISWRWRITHARIMAVWIAFLDERIGCWLDDDAGDF